MRMENEDGEEKEDGEGRHTTRNGGENGEVTRQTKEQEETMSKIKIEQKRQCRDRIQDITRHPHS